jgi:hypothetical protein
VHTIFLDLDKHRLILNIRQDCIPAVTVSDQAKVGADDAVESLISEHGKDSGGKWSDTGLYIHIRAYFKKNIFS